MAIEFNCPHCKLLYKLRDEVAGKRATCKNPDCRKVITIPPPNVSTADPAAVASKPANAPATPKPVPPAGNGPARAGLPQKVAEKASPQAPRPTAESNGRSPTPPDTPPIDVEAAALSALSDAAGPADGTPSEEQQIPMACPVCEHTWAEPVARAGKNVVCPECRHRMKVPVPKKQEAENWREAGTHLPSMAKEKFEKPKDVIDAEAKVVSRVAWQKGGGADADLEPIPLKRRLFFVFATLALVGGVVFGAWYLFRSRGESKQDQLMADALKEFTESADVQTLDKAQLPLFSAVLHQAAGEYSVRLNKPEAIKQALVHFSQAGRDLRLADVKAPGRNAAVIDLAVALLDLGGTDQQVADQIRCRWTPLPPSGRKQRINERAESVQQELVRVTELLQQADIDTKTVAARRLTRALIRCGHPELVEELKLLFAPAERDEGRAVIATELYRADRNSDRARAAADEFAKAAPAAFAKHPSMQTLALLASPPGQKIPGIAVLPERGPPSDEFTRLAYTGKLLLEDNPVAALQVAQAARPGATLVERLRALLLCAEWSADPGPALDAAQAALGKGSALLPPFLPFRLAQIAAVAGRPDQAKALADLIPDDGLKAWARAELIRARLTPESKDPGNDEWLELPTEVKQLRAGHAWGRLCLSRHNARVSGDRGEQVDKAKLAADGPLHPFALAGIALGLQDREK